MPNPRLAARYAKSLIDLSIERDQLEQVYQDMEFLHSICSASREFISVLKSPIISSDKKENILDAVTGAKISQLTATFCKLLIRKGRESNLPEIASAFIQQYKDHQGIYIVKLTTAIPVSEEAKQLIVNKVKSGTAMKNIELNVEVNEDIIGGFVLEVGDHLIDASVAFELNNARKQFQDNDFVYKLR
jgi:F-type H+-transporting ATPase subunit delta